MCHSENRYDDKQNKNRWGLQNCGHHLENRYDDKQNKNRWDMQIMDCGTYKVQTERILYYNMCTSIWF